MRRPFSAWYLLLMACCARDEVPAQLGRQPVETDLRALGQQAVYFGHHSVGSNIMQGVDVLLREAQVPTILPVRDDDATVAKKGVWTHGRVGDNGDPAGKIRDFEERIGGGIGDSADFAFFKLCYVDVNPSTDVDALFSRYRTALEKLKRGYPKTTFVHFTVPLTTLETGLTPLLKKVLGRPLWSEMANLRREQLNALIRRHFKEDPIFDLALLEATDPAGKVQSRHVDGHLVHFLVPAYAADDGHLNAVGQRYVAGELLRFVGQLAAQRQATAQGAEEDGVEKQRAEGNSREPVGATTASPE